MKPNSNDPRYGDNPDQCLECSFTLMKDMKPICRARCTDPPFQMPSICSIYEVFRPKSDDFFTGLSECALFPEAENIRQDQEWNKFMKFLKKYKKVAHAKVGSCDFYIAYSEEGAPFGFASMMYEAGRKQVAEEEHKHDYAARGVNPGIAARARGAVHKTSKPDAEEITKDEKLLEAINNSQICQVADKSCSRVEAATVKRSRPLQSNLMQTHPSYLRTLGQSHSGWIFGAIAELVDNARDAKATKLEISVDMVFSKSSSENNPMLSVIDDGHGMSHQDILRMISFGHKESDAADISHIGRYGIGFKSGAMRLGKDALVLSQTANSRSIAFLSQSFNEGKDSLEIPIVSYRRQGRFMEVDTLVQTEALAKCNLKAIKEFSPFNKYLIGEKAGLFPENGTGTQIYIWNLDKWGSQYCMEWKNEKGGDRLFHKGDILISSRRVRTRPGQTSRTVPLDYSLQSYLEVMFLEPRMKIFVQGSQVKCRPLAKSLSATVVEDGSIAGKHVRLIMGRSRLEWKQANCGIFLYWHGRLIEAYKRVGCMVHCADTGRGVIGVMDVTDIMDQSTGQALVLNNKQGFQDCELYAQLEEWLGKKFNQYWDTKFDSLQVGKDTAFDKPDNDWVQCDKCRKWRMLSPGFDCKQLPLEWFCYMDPFRGQCENLEQKVEPEVITMSTNRGGYDAIHKPLERQNECPKESSGLLGGCKDDLAEEEEEDDIRPVWKRFRGSIS